MTNTLIYLPNFLLLMVFMIGPGLYLIGKIINQFSYAERLTSSLIVGFVFWTILIYFLSILQVRNLSLFIMLMSSLLGWWKVGRGLSWRIKFTSEAVFVLLICIFGVSAQLFLVAPSGLFWADGIRFFGINIHDGLWHVALMRSLVNEFPPELPTFAGQTLKGYHFFVDLFGSELYRLFKFSPLDLTFRFLPLLFSTTAALGVYSLVKRITGCVISAVFGLLILFFAGSFGYIAEMIIPNTNLKETLFWAQQSISTFLNLPLGASFSTMIVSILLFIIWLKNTQSKKLVWIISLLAAATISIKAYGGLILIASYSLTLFIITFKQKIGGLIMPLLFSWLLTALLLIPNIDLNQSTFIVEPGWFLKTMMESPDRVNYPNWELLRQTYLFENNMKRLISLWAFAFVIFFLGNYGIRIIGFVSFIKGLWRKNQYYYFYVLMGLMMLMGFLPPLFFIQRGIVWNSIQFIYYSIMIMGILSSISLALIPSRRKKILATLLLFIFMIPTTIDTMNNYHKKYLGEDYFLLNQIQLESLDYVAQLPTTSPILTPYSESAYFTAFTGKSVYFSDKTQAEILLLPHEEQVMNVNSVYNYGMPDSQLSEFMKQNGLEYLYEPRDPGNQTVSKFELYESIKKVFSNDYASIFKLK